MPSAQLAAAQAQRDALVDQMAEAITAANKGQKVTNKISSQIVALRKAGIDPAGALRELYEEYGKGGVQDRTIILLALQEAGGPSAIDALKAIALDPGDGGATLGPRAVNALSALTNDPDVISDALASKSLETRDAAVMALNGKELTESSVRRLGELLQSDDWGTHHLVAAAFRHDRSMATAAQKVELLLGALPQLDHVKGRLEALMSSSPRDFALTSYVTALANMAGAETVLREKLSDLPAESAAHQILALAIALRGDKTAYPWVLQIAEKDMSGTLRAMAARALGKVGSAADIGLLERLAASDPYKEVATQDDEPGEVTFYPVRSAAGESIKKLRKENPNP